jgi:flagellar FliJ protein
MKKFRFRLQKLLQLRQHRKLEQQKKLAKAERLRRLEEAHLASLHERLAGEQRRPAAQSGKVVDVSRLQQSIRYQERLRADMSIQEQMIIRARASEEKRRTELLEAAKQEKIFAKLKEHQRDDYHAELERGDQKDTDEIATMQFLHK